ncbi:MAG: ATP-binding protein [Planctomycetota bacterium]
MECVARRKPAILGIPADSSPPTFEQFTALVHPHDRDQVTTRLRAALRDPDTPLDMQHRARRPDGAEIWLHCTASMLRPGDGSPPRLLGTVVDITSRKALEAQLLQAQKMESLGRLASGIAHDFNNLLTVILGELDIARVEGTIPESLAECFRNIGNAAERGHQLARQLLGFSRQQALRIDAVDVRASLQSMQAILSRIAGPRTSVALSIDDDLRAALADTSQLGQVLMNLAVNAIDAMPNGGRLTIRAGNFDAPASGPSPAGKWVRISVSDTGSGIDEKTRARLFEPFFTTKENGTGLGLATSHGIVAQFGGMMEVESAPGRGSTFHVLLRSPEKAPTARPETTPKSLLIVENDDQVRNVAQRVLERAGFRVASTANGDQAMAAFEASKFDLVIADVLIPGVDAATLAERIRQRADATKILFISGHRERLEALTHDDRRSFLAKPFTPRALTKKVRELLDDGQGKAPGTKSATT